MTDDDFWEHLDTPCPNCGAHSVRSKSCDEWDCDDGRIDEHEDDPINFAPGEEYVMCDKCCGTGNVKWCSECGCDITRREYLAREARKADDDDNY